MWQKFSYKRANINFDQHAEGRIFFATFAHHCFQKKYSHRPLYAVLRYRNRRVRLKFSRQEDASIALRAADQQPAGRMRPAGRRRCGYPSSRFLTVAEELVRPQLENFRDFLDI